MPTGRLLPLPKAATALSFPKLLLPHLLLLLLPHRLLPLLLPPQHLPQLPLLRPR